MKRISYAIILALLAALVLAGCAQSERLYKNGTYTGSYDARDSHGWKPQLQVVVQKGKIVSAVFDYVNADGALKSGDAAYSERMKSVSGVSPREAAEEMAKRIVETQTAEIDSVTGATHSTENFRVLARAVLEQAKTGNTAPVVVPMNDTYTAQDDPDERGYTGKIQVTYENGRIVKVVYDEVDKDGNPKRTNESYNSMMQSHGGVSWLDAVTTLEAALVTAQKVDGVDSVTGATGASARFLALAAKAIAQR